MALSTTVELRGSEEAKWTFILEKQNRSRKGYRRVKGGKKLHQAVWRGRWAQSTSPL